MKTEEIKLDGLGKAVQAACDKMDELRLDLAEIAELVGYDKKHPGLSLTEFIEEMQKDLEGHLCREGKGDSLRYLVTQACNKIYAGGPVGKCATHGEKPHARVSDCKSWGAL